jgi:chromosome segregation ATPase
MIPSDSNEITQTARASVTPPVTRFRSSMRGVRTWLAQRGASTLQVEPDDAGAPTNLNKAAAEFSRQLWEVAIVQARVELDAERSVSRAQVAKAQADAEAAKQASDAAREQVTDVERRLTVAHRARQEVDAHLKDANARNAELKKQLVAVEDARSKLESQLADAVARHGKSERQIEELQKALDRAVEDAEQRATRHEQQLERAKLHYAELESELGTVLQHHKSARQKLEKNFTGRDKG